MTPYQSANNYGTYRRSPIHISEIRPLSDEVEQGDLWLNPVTNELRVYDLGKWVEVTRRGIMGFEGREGPPGPPGKSIKGEKGNPGKDGANADMSLVVPLAESVVKDHEKKFDHDLIDPFLLGTKKISEAGMEDGMVVTFDEKGNRLIYTTIRQISSKISRLSGRGLSLPSQTGNAGKFLTTDGNRSSWGTPSSGITFSDREVPTGAINDVNVTFTLAHTPTAGSEHLYRNGVLQNVVAGSDYTISGITITMTTAPETGDILLVSYRYT